MKSSPMGRTFELAKLAAQVGLKELRSGDFNSRVEQAVLIAKSLSHLKGAAMKVGQLMSLDLDSYFPPEAIEILRQLQNSAIAHPFPEIEKVLNSELSADKRLLLDSISPTPIAVASIGQVHKARYRGRDIVLKVQFDEVAGSIDADLKILKTLATSLCQITGRDMNLTPLFQEFRGILEQEVDYIVEAEFQAEFSRRVAQLAPNSSCNYRVPEVIKELSSKKVLAMNFEEGLTFRQWLGTKPSQQKKDRLALAILNLYFHEFFEWGMVQTDPNWGNFLIYENGSDLSMCLLDFGATKKYSRDFIQDYIRLLDYTASGDSNNLKALAIEMRLLDARESAAAFKAFEHMLKTSIKPFFLSQPGSNSFSFADQNHLLESQTSAKALSRELIYSPPPHTIVFLHRKLAGVYSMLKSLEVKIDVSPYWQMMKDLSAGESSDETV